MVKSIKNRLILLFSLLLVITAIIVASFFYYDYQNSLIQDSLVTIGRVNANVQKKASLEKDFYAYDAINPAFYQTGQSVHLAFLKDARQQLSLEMERLLGSKVLKGTSLYQPIDSMRMLLAQGDEIFEQLVLAVKKCGFKDHGLVGELRKHVHAVENCPYPMDRALLLTMRRHEKDYLLRKQEKYADQLSQAVSDFKADVNRRIKHTAAQQEILGLVEAYHAAFVTMVGVDREIGSYTGHGLRSMLTRNTYAAVGLAEQLNHRIVQLEQERSKVLKQGLITMISFGVLLDILLIIFVNRTLTRPLVKLSKSIHAVVQHDFSHNHKTYIHNTEDEVGTLSKDVGLMLQKFHNEKDKVQKQKAELGQAYQNLQMMGHVGKSIISKLSMDGLVLAVYEHVSKLMTADVLVIGQYMPKDQRLQFWGARQKKQAFTFGVDVLTNRNLLCVQCFTQARTFFISDTEHFPPKLYPFSDGLGLGERQSFIYHPLIFNGKPIGIISIQCYQKQAFSERHVQMLHNIAIYASIALENTKAFDQIDKQRTDIVAKNAKLSEAVEELMVTQATIEEQRNLANKQRQKITDSIQYASTIQSAMLPPTDFLTEVFPEHFVLYKPKDIVSGDFYWYHRNDDKLYIAVADCTGHGVPGAFMSMLGIVSLSEVVIKHPFAKANEILKLLRDIIKTTLKQGRQSTSKDGMDIALAIIDLKERTLEYAGAYNPLYLVSNQQLKELKGDKMPVGYRIREKDSFSLTQVSLKQGDCIYMFSDGFPDQVNGSDGQKFKIKQLKDLILANHQLPMNQQQQLFEDTLRKWQGGAEQIDDVLLFGASVTFSKVTLQKTHSYSWEGKTILVIEDEQYNQVILKGILKQTGAHLLWATDGEEGLAVFEQSSTIDLVLTDIRMPIMDGYKLVEAIRHLSPTIPIVVQSSYAEPEEQQKMIEAGADSFVEKPVSKRILLMKLDKFFRQNRGAYHG